MTVLAKKMKAWRSKRKMTIKAAAAHFGVSVATIERIERGLPCHRTVAMKLTKEFRGSWWKILEDSLSEQEAAV